MAIGKLSPLPEPNLDIPRFLSAETAEKKKVFARHRARHYGLLKVANSSLTVHVLICIDGKLNIICITLQNGASKPVILQCFILIQKICSGHPLYGLTRESVLGHACGRIENRTRFSIGCVVQRSFDPKN